ncbi:MAG: lysylphosphatidylglycerol synthase transmembrane domain-containing protein [Pseudomonadota bacterium]
MRRPAPSWAWRAGQIAVAVGLLALLWQAADGPAAAESLGAADWRLLACGFAALTLQTILSALRWQLTARHLGMSFGAGHAIREYYLSQIVNQSLPGGMVGDAGRAYRARAEAGLLASGQAVILERLVGQIAMFLMLTMAFVATSLVPGGLDWPRWLMVPVAVVIAVGLSLPLVLRTATHLGGMIGRGATILWRALSAVLIDRQIIAGQIVLSTGTTLCNLAAFAFCARAVGVDLSLPAVAALVPLILFTMLIPFSISGWGFREGAAAALLPLAGATASGGLASSIAFGLTFIAAVLPGVLFLRLKPQAAALK